MDSLDMQVKWLCMWLVLIWICKMPSNALWARSMKQFSEYAHQTQKLICLRYLWNYFLKSSHHSSEQRESWAHTDKLTLAAYTLVSNTTSIYPHRDTQKLIQWMHICSRHLSPSSASLVNFCMYIFCIDINPNEQVSFLIWKHDPYQWTHCLCATIYATFDVYVMFHHQLHPPAVDYVRSTLWKTILSTRQSHLMICWRSILFSCIRSENIYVLCAVYITFYQPSDWGLCVRDSNLCTCLMQHNVFSPKLSIAFDAYLIFHL